MAASSKYRRPSARTAAVNASRTSRLAARVVMDRMTGPRLGFAGGIGIGWRAGLAGEGLSRIGGGGQDGLRLIATPQAAESGGRRAQLSEFVEDLAVERRFRFQEGAGRGAAVDDAMVVGQ